MPAVTLDNETLDLGLRDHGANYAANLPPSHVRRPLILDTSGFRI